MGERDAKRRARQALSKHVARRLAEDLVDAGRGLYLLHGGEWTSQFEEQLALIWGKRLEDFHRTRLKFRGKKIKEIVFETLRMMEEECGITQWVTHDMIADLVGTTRETVTRSLKDLMKEGRVEMPIPKRYHVIRSEPLTEGDEKE